METNKEIVFDLNGIKYLLVDVAVTDENKEKMIDDFKKYEIDYRGLKEMKEPKLFFPGYIIMEILIPEKNIIECNALMLGLSLGEIKEENNVQPVVEKQQSGDLLIVGYGFKLLLSLCGVYLIMEIMQFLLNATLRNTPLSEVKLNYILIVGALLMGGIAVYMLRKIKSLTDK